MRRKQRIILTVIMLVLAVAASAIFYYRSSIRQLLTPKPDVPPAQTLVQFEDNNPKDEQVATATDPVIPVAPPTVTSPKEINLAVPFQSQAPFGDWSLPYGEACEEASIIMVDHYLQGTSLSKQEMKDAIDQMVAWQIKNWEGHVDLNIKTTIDLAQQFYSSYSYTIITDLTADKIKEQLSAGHPVIVPAAGRELHNPNFKVPGPIYHMLVIKGFTKDGKFITNDPGTRNGSDYVYTPSVLLNAIHDWTGAAADGNRVGFVINKK
ncbi:MAG: C39 family peptidase [Candidatus Komeilibacteria bacterium]